MIKKITTLIMVTTMIFVGTVGCSHGKTEEKAETEVSTQDVEVTESKDIFDGKKEIRSFMISELCHKTEDYYIETYEIVEEDSKNILHLIGNFRIKGTMDGEVSTATEAKLEIADECVFHDNRSEYQDKTDLNLEAFKKHIGSEDFSNPMSMEITVDNGLVWLVELGN